MYVYDDSEVKGRIKELESRDKSPVVDKYDDSELQSRLSVIGESIKSLDKRIDYVRRNSSEIWEQAETNRVKFQSEIRSVVGEVNEKIKSLMG